MQDKGLVPAYGTIGSPDHASLQYIDMRVAKGSSFHIEVDALHQLQTRVGIDLMSNLIAQRARAIAIKLDELVAKTLLAAVSGKDLNGNADANAAVSGLTALHGQIDEITDAPTGDNVTRVGGKERLSVYHYVVAMLENLDIKSAPADRFLFISPRMRSLLLRDPNFIQAQVYGGSPVIPNGASAIGTILGVPVTVANALGSHTRPNNPLIKKGNQAFQPVDLYMGATAATSVVIPFAQMEAYKPQQSFTDAIKSRVIYDAKVIRPEQLVVARNVEAAITAHNGASTTPATT
ncbi:MULTISPECIES: hypothetical protein [Streptomycetaceae]|uniref:Gp6-like protein n=1 Tax=Streptantibioticus cattleyicolor (strain ATCC 35852 / DSM 46488 / JCM 4925 / NBRC 14057 / NRRL 8057) TaxID=1003195 RepID=F8JPY3_STREN|nr:MULTISPECIES: hypothetical protein [Streptomycetaceae]AEW94038.1 Gp6-like protein [Streptantibioticus cattleyicolor NRRL 8057 = DSM 46488]MYS58712.1 hypothetical protein [Streptomyces sp. SID5468]CCB74391.1 protein of unknown function [Streptantibioticus cattleyicolor NRRL 8057 = DSM 46488]